MIVRARRRVPAWLVPRAARTARLGFVDAEAVLRIPEVGAREVRPCGHGCGVPLHEHAGRTWFKVADRDGRPLAGGRLASWLEGDRAPGDRHPFAHLFLRSPLLPAPLAGAAGIAEPGRADARILAVAPGCGSEEAGRWASENLLVAGGAVHMRLRPLLGFRPAGAGAALVEAFPCPGDWLSRLRAPASGEDPDRELPWFAFAAGMASDAVRFAAEGAGIRATSGALDRPGAGDEGAAAQANVLPERVWGEARRVLAAHARRPVGAPGAEAGIALRADALLPHVLDGIAGCVAPSAAGAVLERCLALSRAVQDFAGPLWSVTRLPLIDRYVAEHALPRLACPHAPDDLDALAGLAP